MRVSHTIDHRNYYDRYENERRNYYQFTLNVDIDNDDPNFNAIYQIFKEASEKTDKIMLDAKNQKQPSVPDIEQDPIYLKGEF